MTNENTTLRNDLIVLEDADCISCIHLPPIDYPSDDQSVAITTLLEITELPARHKDRLNFLNPKGTLVDELNEDNFPIRLENGFRTIVDFMTVYNQIETPGATIVSQVYSSYGNPQGLIDLEKIFYKQRVNGETINFQFIFDLLMEEGFTKIFSCVNYHRFLMFDEKNLPYMWVDLNLNNTTKSKAIEGRVTVEFYEKLEPLFLSQMRRTLRPVRVTQLDGYEKDRSGKVSGDFSPVFLTNKMDYALPEFYPWIKMPLKAYFQEFLASKANVLVLIGPPGTGKSTLIRTMIRDLYIRAMVAYKPAVVESPDFIHICQEFINSTMGETTELPEGVPVGLARLTGLQQRQHGKNTGGVQPTAIVVEDADIIMGRRSDGNQHMSEILNATNGIATDTRSKFILSTNLKNVDDIDPALLRPGRCFDILCFRPLTAQEAMVVRELRELNFIEFNPNHTYKLAEALNDKLDGNKVEPIVRPRFGFI